MSLLIDMTEFTPAVATANLDECRGEKLPLRSKTMAIALFQKDVVEQLPSLRSFARYLARDRSLADDLVQDTVLRALTNIEKFEPGTNLKAWLMTILRNQFYNEMRSRRQSATYVATLKSEARPADQEVQLEIRDLQRAFYALPKTQSEALWLVGASGFSYEEAAEISGCAEGTVKSRVSRARTGLDRHLATESQSACRAHVLGPNPMMSGSSGHDRGTRCASSPAIGGAG